MTVTRDKKKSGNTEKMLLNTIKMRRWLIIGGIAVGVQGLLSIFSYPESNAYIFKAMLALGCIGYGLSMTPKIRRLSQGAVWISKIIVR